jgi:hypothetical protein
MSGHDKAGVRANGMRYLLELISLEMLVSRVHTPEAYADGDDIYCQLTRKAVGRSVGPGRIDVTKNKKLPLPTPVRFIRGRLVWP